MSEMKDGEGIDHLWNHVTRLGPGRRIIAIAGAPGSGKSTIAERFSTRLNARERGMAAVLPMDGYHYDDRVLVARGLHRRKGAPETFDVEGLRHMLERLRTSREDEIAVPVFDRDLELSRAGARLIARSTSFILVEGNYLLLSGDPWSVLRPFFDVTVMVEVREDERRRRLFTRWEGYALSADEIRRKVEENDLPNGLTVQRESIVADFTIS